MQITREFAKYQLLPVAFAQANVAASQTNVQILSDGVEGVSMPFAGEVLAIAVDTSAAATAGSLTVGVTKGGTENATTTQTLTTGTAAVKAFPRGTMTFIAGDKIGAEITSSADWDATTAELSVKVFVALAIEGI